MSAVNGKDEKLSEVPLNLSNYIGRGLVSERLQGTGYVKYVDF